MNLGAVIHGGETSDKIHKQLYELLFPEAKDQELSFIKRAAEIFSSPEWNKPIHVVRKGPPKAKWRKNSAKGFQPLADFIMHGPR